MGNPATTGLNKYVDANQEGASYLGSSWKAGFFVVLSILSAVLGWSMLYNHPALTVTLLIVSSIVTIVASILASFFVKTVPVTGTIYAIGEGFMVGCISALFDAAWSGVVLGAFLCTMVTFGMMMILYSTGVIRVGNRFRKFFLSALLGLCATQFLIFLVGLFYRPVWTIFYGSGPIAIIVSVVMVLIASLSILSDLDNTTYTVQNGLPKAYEWRAAFGIAVSLIWLYVEFLRLFAIIASTRSN